MNEQNQITQVIREELYGNLDLPRVVSHGSSGLPSWFDVTGLCIASIGSACAEIAALNGQSINNDIKINRARASGWFGMTIRPEGWELPPVWDSIAGLYQTKNDRWIRLHTNAPHHRQAALNVLGSTANKDSVAQAVLTWNSTELEAAIVRAGGCAAEMRSMEDWARHPQGQSVEREPLIHWNTPKATREKRRKSSLSIAPLAGVRVLDCTRILAGPVCTRFLAGYGADVLRIDPPAWSEPNVVPEVTLGKRTTTLDLKSHADRSLFAELLRSADVLVHGYRPGALESLGLGETWRRSENTDLIEISLNAYGWTGPWANRRGYDSLVQMSCGIADLGMQRSGNSYPTPLPVQALDHATGYLMATSAVRALRVLFETGEIVSAKMSLARTAALLIRTLREYVPPLLADETKNDLCPSIEKTDWGPARRLKFPLDDEQLQPDWKLPARNLHQDPARWQNAPAQ